MWLSHLATLWWSHWVTLDKCQMLNDKNVNGKFSNPEQLVFVNVSSTSTSTLTLYICQTVGINTICSHDNCQRRLCIYKRNWDNSKHTIPFNHGNAGIKRISKMWYLEMFIASLLYLPIPHHSSFSHLFNLNIPHGYPHSLSPGPTFQLISRQWDNIVSVCQLWNWSRPSVDVTHTHTKMGETLCTFLCPERSQ